MKIAGSSSQINYNLFTEVFHVVSIIPRAHTCSAASQSIKYRSTVLLARVVIDGHRADSLFKYLQILRKGQCSRSVRGVQLCHREMNNLLLKRTNIRYYIR